MVCYRSGVWLPYQVYCGNLSRTQNSSGRFWWLIREPEFIRQILATHEGARIHVTICVTTISILSHSNMTIMLPRDPMAQWTKTGSRPSRINLYVRIHRTICVATNTIGSTLICILPRGYIDPYTLFRYYIHLYIPFSVSYYNSPGSVLENTSGFSGDINVRNEIMYNM